MGNNWSNDPDYKDPDYKLWVGLLQARDTMFKARERELGQYGIRARHSAVLAIVNAIEGKATISEISRWLLREHHTVSSILTRMEKEGLVRKVRGSGKKDEIKVTLTERGRQAYSQSLKRESIREMLSCLSEEERQQLGSFVEKLRDSALKYLATIKVPFP